MLAELFRSLVPPRCVRCGATGVAMCGACRSELPAPAEVARVAFVDRVLCPWDYDGTARKLILDLKLRGLSAAADPLVAGMVDFALRKGLAGSWVTWVPCREVDRRRRGFDHAEVLARGVARGLGLPRRLVLSRTGATLDQAGLGAAQRAQNLRHAFACGEVAGRVVLVDDLVTTGATASACARVLRSSGATGVEVLSPCRA
jgi:ComF family protein